MNPMSFSFTPKSKLAIFIFWFFGDYILFPFQPPGGSERGASLRAESEIAGIPLRNAFSCWVGLRFGERFGERVPNCTA